MHDGFFLDNTILWGGIPRGSLACGIKLEAPDLRVGDTGQLNVTHENLVRLLSGVKPGYRLQLRWQVHSDYRQELAAYKEASEKCFTPWVKRIRQERHARYSKQMQERSLRREKLTAYLIDPMQGLIRPKLGSKGLEKFFRETVATRKKLLQRELLSICSIIGGGELMGDKEHFEEMLTHYNPSLVERETGAELDSWSSIRQQCIKSDSSHIEDGIVFSDGYYHGVLALETPPNIGYQGIVYALTSLEMLDYRVVVNLERLKPEKEITRLEKRYREAEADARAENSIALQRTAEQLAEQIKAVSDGYSAPYNVSYVIQAWSPSIEELKVKMGQLKSALSSMNGAQGYELNLAASVHEMIDETAPGMAARRKAHQWFTLSPQLATILPFSSTFTGRLNQADAIYDGAESSLVGVKLFENNSPQHTAVFGESGAGKSVNMVDLLSQVADFYSYIFIIEEGLSYGVLTELMGEKPIIFHPDRNMTINPFDTGGLPLSNAHIGMVTGFLETLCGGAGAAAREDRMDRARISKMVQRLYQSHVEDWLQDQPDEKIWNLQREVFALEQWKKDFPDLTQFELRADFQAALDADKIDWDDFDEGEIIRFSADEKNTFFLRNYACAILDNYPEMAQFVEGARLYSNKEEKEIGMLLEPWLRSGDYGSIFDGQQTVDLTRRFTHVELGQMPESAATLKTAVGFLISNQARNHILTLPRREKKMMLFEEVARFFQVPGGEKIVGEAYAQMRKFNTVVMSITQVYQDFAESNIAERILGNTKSFLVMRMNNENDLNGLSQATGMPNLTKARVSRFPMPEKQSNGDRYSALAMVYQDGGERKSGVMYHRANPEVITAAATSGDGYLELRKQWDGQTAFEAITDPKELTTNQKTT